MSSIVLGLNNGRDIIANKVMLYPAKLVEQAVKLRGQAMSKMGNVSSGIGFIGSPGWAIAGSLLVSAMESAVNSKNHQEGCSLLKMADNFAEEAKANSRMIDVETIANIHQPNPSIWHIRYLFEETISFERMSEYDINKQCEKFGFNKNDIYKSGIFKDLVLIEKSKKAQWSDDLIHNGDEFIIVETGYKIMHIKWTDVSTYYVTSGDEIERVKSN